MSLETVRLLEEHNKLLQRQLELLHTIADALQQSPKGSTEVDLREPEVKPTAKHRGGR